MRIEDKAGRIKLLLLDVDGVLTDGRILLDQRGGEQKSFDVKDGEGLKLLLRAGLTAALVSGRRSEVVERRAQELGIEAVYQGVKDKSSVCRQLQKQRSLDTEEICCIGDDLPDLAMFSEAGLRMAVADAVQEVREAADMVLSHKGGRGAVREACEWLLRKQGKWKQSLAGLGGQDRSK